MSEQTVFEKLGVKYIEKDGIFYPLITADTEESTNIGKYGSLWVEYIRAEYPQRYRSLVRFGDLSLKATEVNELAYELLGEHFVRCRTKFHFVNGYDVSPDSHL